MPTFSDASNEKLSQCDSRLRQVMQEIVKSFDCTILCGYRGETDQNAAVAAGNSKLSFPNSMHNKTPSMAVDVVPYPIVWPDQENDLQLRQAEYERIYYFAGQVMATARQMGIKLRWGGDWNGTLDPRTQIGHFTDLPHFELTD
jgi:peptidoglycan L-alanyl-D-glutamate endopeptidase CwlK